MSNESTKFNKLLSDAWEHKLEEDPLFATFCGDKRYNDKLPALTPEDFDKRLKTERSFLKRLYTIERSKLSHEEKINYDIFESITRDSICDYEFKSYLMPVNKVFGFQVTFPQISNHSPLENEQDYRNYLTRLQGFKHYVEQNIALMKIGMQENYIVSRASLEGSTPAIQAQLVENPEDSVLFRPFITKPKNIDNQVWPQMVEQAKKVIADSVVPGYRLLLQFLEEEYFAAARESFGLSEIPQGKEHYCFLVRHYTSLNITPQEVHEIGLEEVKRVRGEMDIILKELEFKGTLAEFVEKLRKDDRFFVKKPEDLLKEVSFILKKMDGELPRLFKTLPRTPCGIRPIPEYAAEQMPCAYYMPPSGNGDRAGHYYINTSKLDSRPLYEMEALSLHEAVPGHHLQIALQQEIKGLAAFRRFGMFTAFIEGWALYAERLGLEVGFYQDPYSNFARLIYEAWRSCRLVVDTGIHYFGWSRQKAIDYFTENSALTSENIVVEVDRYISMPGQAVAYKIGELKIRKLRAKAEQELGKNFDLREFHEVLLNKGSIPLTWLEKEVNQYIEANKQ